MGTQTKKEPYHKMRRARTRLEGARAALSSGYASDLIEDILSGASGTSDADCLFRTLVLDEGWPARGSACVVYDAASELTARPLSPAPPAADELAARLAAGIELSSTYIRVLEQAGYVRWERLRSNGVVTRVLLSGSEPMFGKGWEQKEFLAAEGHLRCIRDDCQSECTGSDGPAHAGDSCARQDQDEDLR